MNHPVNWWEWFVAVWIVLHSIWHAKPQTQERCACGASRPHPMGPENDALLGHLNGCRLLACRDCGAVYAWRLYP